MGTAGRPRERMQTIQELQFSLTQESFGHFADRMAVAGLTIVDTQHTLVEHLNPQIRDRESFQGQIVHLDRRYLYRRDLQGDLALLHVSKTDENLEPIDDRLVEALDRIFPRAPAVAVRPRQPASWLWSSVGWLVLGWVCLLLLLGCSRIFRWF